MGSGYQSSNVRQHSMTHGHRRSGHSVIPFFRKSFLSSFARTEESSNESGLVAQENRKSVGSNSISLGAPGHGEQYLIAKRKNKLWSCIKVVGEMRMTVGFSVVSCRRSGVGKVHVS